MKQNANLGQSQSVETEREKRLKEGGGRRQGMGDKRGRRD